MIGNEAKKKIGFAIVGTGSIASVHAMAIDGIPEATLVAVYSRNYTKAKTFANTYQTAAFSELEELLKLSEIDVVCICTPSGFHAVPALQAIEAGKHCLIEKPLEVTLEKCDAIIALAREKAVTVGVVFPSRLYEESKQLKLAIDQGRFGRLALGSAYVKWSRTPEYYNETKWRGTNDMDGGGALMNQAIHTVDMLQWLMGEVEFVQAFTTNIRHLEIEVEDTVVANLKFKNGALGSIECSTALYPGVYKKLEIMGTNGSVIIEDNRMTKWDFDKEKTEDKDVVLKLCDTTSVDGGVSNPLNISTIGHQQQLQDFIDAISFGQQPLVNAEEGRKSVAIILAIYESARTGKIIKIKQ